MLNLAINGLLEVGALQQRKYKSSRVAKLAEYLHESNYCLAKPVLQLLERLDSQQLLEYEHWDEFVEGQRELQATKQTLFWPAVLDVAKKLNDKLKHGIKRTFSSTGGQ